MAGHYFAAVRFPPEAEAELRALHERGFVVHVMRTTAWINYLYLTWALVRRGLPPVRAVVNVRPWFAKPWRNAAQRGDFDVRFTYARRHHGSGLVFLKRSAFGRAEGRDADEDPFPSLVAMARKSDRPVFLVPELFVWEKWLTRLKPGLIDFIFGSPEAPGFLHSLLAFWRNHHRAQFRVGEPIDLGKFISEQSSASDAVIARKVRGALYHHLARETRAVFGPPAKPTSRLIEEAMRDRSLRKALEAQARQTQKPVEALARQAQRDLHSIAAKPNTTLLALAEPVLSWIFNRIYDGIEVDEPGLERALKAAARAPVVLCPSHKSHIDYLIMDWVLWTRGYATPLVAAGANLSFFPLGLLFRRGGAFFLRRSFRDDKVYTAAFKAYIKKLVHDGVHHEFFPEGGRSRTGKLLQPKLGMFTWEVDAILEGAREELYFVPVAIDYEKVVEGGEYSKELAGAEKKAEDLGGLLSARKVLSGRYGRIHLTFDEPVSLAALMSSRGLSASEDVPDDAKKALVRALGHRVMFGISRVSTVTPHALLASALLAHRRRGITAAEVTSRIQLLRRIAGDSGNPLSSTLRDASSDPTAPGPLQKAIQSFIDDGIVTAQEARGEVIYQIDENRRAQLSFNKNTLVNIVAPVSLVSTALLAAGGHARLQELEPSALFASRLFKLEFIYRVGATFDVIFRETVAKLARMGLLSSGEQIAAAPEAKGSLEFLADLTRDYFETYWLAALTLQDVARAGALDRKAFIRAALENGRAEFLSGAIGAAEALSKTTLENGLAWLLDQGYLVEKEKKLSLGTAAPDLSERIRRYGWRRA
ncbi:MAG TPA: 1-acyl-sn-glycerol-3-phosphate acyltransferase [Myxococcaceae bacterium]|nr:1-acyl-sn-glycerol-3-phosphate acyltransferase [Myxococcaceae bacterium]